MDIHAEIMHRCNGIHKLWIREQARLNVSLYLEAKVNVVGDARHAAMVLQRVADQALDCKVIKECQAQLACFSNLHDCREISPAFPQPHIVSSNMRWSLRRRE